MTAHPADAALQAHKRHHVSAQITALAQRAARQRRQRESACAQDIVALWRRLGRRDDAAFESLHQLITSAQGEQAVAAVAAQRGVPSGQSREAVAAPPGAVTGALLRHLVSLVECPFPAVASAATSILYANVTPPACNNAALTDTHTRLLALAFHQVLGGCQPRLECSIGMVSSSPILARGPACGPSCSTGAWSAHARAPGRR